MLLLNHSNKSDSCDLYTCRLYTYETFSELTGVLLSAYLHKRSPDAVILQVRTQLLHGATETVETPDGRHLNFAHRVRQTVHNVLHQVLAADYLQGCIAYTWLS